MPDTQRKTLERLIERARAHKMSATERREQRISMAMGLRSHESTVSRETVEQFMGEMETTEKTAA